MTEVITDIQQVVLSLQWPMDRYIRFTTMLTMLMWYLDIPSVQSLSTAEYIYKAPPTRITLQL